MVFEHVHNHLVDSFVLFLEDDDDEDDDEADEEEGEQDEVRPKICDEI